MEEKLFKVSGRFEQGGLWSDLTEDFIGYFLLNTETNIFIGYMEEQYESPYDNERYITGLLFEEDGVTRFTFLKLVNESELMPIMYAFADISQNGYWSIYNMFGGGFSYSDGEATIVLEEVGMTDDLKSKILEKYNKIFEKGIPWNVQLSQGVKGLIDFVKNPGECAFDKSADLIADDADDRYEAFCSRFDSEEDIFDDEEFIEGNDDGLPF